MLTVHLCGPLYLHGPLYLQCLVYFCFCVALLYLYRSFHTIWGPFTLVRPPQLGGSGVVCASFRNLCLSFADPLELVL